MSHFHFVTNWAFDAPIERVWAMINQPEEFPSWWPGFEQATVLHGDGEIGSVTRYRVRGNLGLVFDFTMTVEETRFPQFLRLRAAGDFTGSGEWQLRAAGEKTEVTYIWDVQVHSLWPQILSWLPGSRRFLQRSHDKVMMAGGARLARLLQEQA